MENFSKSNEDLELFGVDIKNDNFNDDVSSPDKLIIKDSLVDEKRLKGLNNEQACMIVNIARYLYNNPDNKRYFTVQGGGGTGKSFSINRALSHIHPSNIIASAPSHFAKNVLKDFLGKDYKVTTIAYLLGKKISYDKNGKQVLIDIPGILYPPITNYSIILIDEGSMIDDQTANEILEYVKSGNKSLIILGDYCQLPPVSQDHDSLFFSDISAELTIPMRFTGYIYDFSTIFRKEINKIRVGLIPSLNVVNLKTDRISRIDERGSGYIFIQNINKFIVASLKRFRLEKGVDYVRILAYRNKTIDKLNYYIRKGLYGNNPVQFEYGELLISDGGYRAVTGTDYQGKEIMTRIIDNGEVYIVTNTEHFEGPYSIPSIKLTFKDVSFDADIIVIAEEGQDLYDRVLSRLTRIAKKDSSYWGDVFKFKDSFAYFKYSYATSIHKAQGSTIKHVFVMEDDIYAVKPTTLKEKLQSMYVAISRASFRCYIYNQNYKVNMDEVNRKFLKFDYETKIKI